MISWRETNGSFLAYNKGRFVGLVSQNPPNTANAGMYELSFKTIDEGLIAFGPFLWIEEALDTLEVAIGLNWTYDRFMTEYPNGYGIRVNNEMGCILPPVT